MGSIGKGIEPCQQTTEWLLTSDFWLFLEPWYGRWYEYEIFIASCADSIYDLENERWLFGDMIDHVGIFLSKVAEGLSAFNVGLVISYNLTDCVWITIESVWAMRKHQWRKKSAGSWDHFPGMIYHLTGCKHCRKISMTLVIRFSWFLIALYKWWKMLLQTYMTTLGNV